MISFLEAAEGYLHRAAELVELEPEMLEFLLLGVRHDGFSLLILLDRHPLFVPIDRFGFLDAR